MTAAPSAFSHVLPSAWSKCQWVLMRCLIASRLRLLAASSSRGRDAVIPASMKTLPSAPVSTAMFPPDPSKMLTSRRSLCTLIGALAASSRIESTMLRASAKASRGVSQRPVAVKLAEPRQHRQNARRERKCRRAGGIISSYIRSEIAQVVGWCQDGWHLENGNSPFNEGEQVCVDLLSPVPLRRCGCRPHHCGKRRSHGAHRCLDLSAEPVPFREPTWIIV